MRNFLILVFFFGTFTGHAQTMPPIPELWGVRVHDEAGVLSADIAARMEQVLKQHEDSTGNQIAVLIIKTLSDYPMEDYTLKVVEKWKLGTEKNDNGVLLFAAIEDRRVRIEVGHGLEGVLPDAVCSQIIRHEIAPAFRQGDYQGGVAAALVAITQSIAGEYHQDVKEPPKGRRRSSLVPFIVVLVIVALLSSNRRRGGGRRGGGGWSAGSGWFPMGGLLGGGGGWSGGGGGGFGGFSGGGGSFGGGGSSGSW